MKNQDNSFLVLFGGILGLVALFSSDSASSGSFAGSSLNLTWPLPNHPFINDPFGTNRTNRGKKYSHNGIDTNTPSGTIIGAVESGRVIKIGWQPCSAGYYVIVQHTKNGVKFRSTYGHMLRDSAFVKVGDKVVGGQALGKVGNTGHSTRPHLHFGLQIYLNGRWVFVDPEPHFSAIRRASFEISEPHNDLELAAYNPQYIRDCLKKKTSLDDTGQPDYGYQDAYYDPYGDVGYNDDIVLDEYTNADYAMDWNGDDFALAQGPRSRPQKVLYVGRDGRLYAYWHY